MYDQLNYSTQAALSYVRVFHASPDAPAVDVYANNVKIGSYLSYRGFTPYMRLTPGRYHITVYPANTQTTAVINSYIDLQAGMNLTICAVGMLHEIKAVVVRDTKRPITKRTLQVKVVNLIPDSPAIDVVSDREVLAKGLRFTQLSKNRIILPGNLTINAYAGGTNTLLLTAPNQNLGAQKYYTLYLIGCINTKPAVQLISALDKSSY